MKYFFIFLTLLALSACQPHGQNRTSWWQDNGKLKVLTTIAAIDDLVTEIGGEYVDTISLINGELDPHSYELVKGDDEKFARADLIFYNGLGLEHGMSLRNNLEGNTKATPLGNVLLKEKTDLVLSSGGQYDPHIWMDIALWVRLIDPIVEQLCQIDNDHAEIYMARGACLRQKMIDADQRAFSLLQALPQERRYLVTSHDAFHYFTRHYLAEPHEENWQARCAAPEGLAPEAELSVTDILEIMHHIETYRVTTLFPESNLSQDALKKLKSAGKAKGLTLRLCDEKLYGDTMGDANSYLEMINHNVDVIASELGKAS